MCGIAGFVGSGDQKILNNMISAIGYRGPDDRGFFIRENVGLAQARLSIIDLSSAGHQPMTDDLNNLWIVFNGEIYNFPELKEELLKTGRYQFKSQSDTEFILYAYREWGTKCFEKMNGMFALALYDFNEKKLILARDRLGKKPLYWGCFGANLFFGSELKALLAHPLVKKEIDLTSLNKYLLFEYVPTPQSIFKNIFKLEPGSFLIFKDGHIVKQKFWRINFETSNIGLAETVALLDKKIAAAVKRRLVADVPLGIFLSGGIDSSTIAYYAQQASVKKIKTIAIGFEEKSFDEARYARRVADWLGTDHYEESVSAQKTLAVIPEIFERLDEPLADASIIPTFVLSRLAKQKVTVALGGDGSDELFAGYPTFQAQSLVDLYVKIPDFLKAWLGRGLDFLPASERNFSWDFKLRQFLRAADATRQRRHQEWLGSFGRGEREALLTKETWQAVAAENEYAGVDQYFSESQEGEAGNQLLYFYLRTYLMDQVLVKVDRASMYNALEVRAPFLDYQLVEFMSRLPYSYKYRRWQTKFILKQLMKDKLPREIVFRPKKGFGLPLARWLKNELRPLCEELLAEDRIKKDGFFNFTYVDRLKQDHWSAGVIIANPFGR